MRRWLAPLFVLLLTSPASAQILDPPGNAQITAAATSCITTPAGCATFNLSGAQSIGIQIIGTYSGTLQFEGTVDGQTWASALAIKLSDGSSATSTTSTGQFSITNAGFLAVRVRCSAYTSGTASVVGVRGYATAKWLTPFLSTVYAGDGTAAAPSYSFLNGPTYGFSFNSSAGSIGVSRAGVETARFDGSGLTMRSDWFITWNSGALGAGAATPDVILSRDAANTLALKNSTTAQKFVMYQTTTGPVANTLDMTAPTISSGFGTSPSIVAGSTAFSMRVNVGTGGAATSGVVGMPTATTGWNCQVQDMTNNVATRQSASTTTTVTFTAAAAWTASDILVATCIKY